MTTRLFALALALACAAYGNAPVGAADSGADVAPRPDSSHFLPRGVHVSLEGGVTQMRSPVSVSDRYSPGLALGGALTAPVGSHARIAVRVEYFDLPNGEMGYFGSYQFVDGQVQTLPGTGYNAFHGGHTSEALGVFSLRALGPFWLEGGAGYGYFWSGYPDIQFIDGATGQYIDIPGQSGWAPALTVGLTYEFTPRKGRHLFASARWTRLERDDVSLEFIPVSIGYRFD